MSLSKATLLDADEFEQALAAAGARPLAAFRQALAHGRQLLREAHLAGATGPDIVSGHAWLVDQLLRAAWHLHRSRLNTSGALALVAVGGYGRGELHPASDVDLMLLLEKRDRDRVRPFAEAFLSFLWDLGLEVGHSVRSLKDCVREAKKDITVATNLMESRLLAGDTALHTRMQQLTAAPKVWPSKAFFAAKWQEQIARHQRFHDTAYNLEPNLKEGPGGLRDIQMIAWVAKRHFDADALHDLVERGFLTEEEYRALIRGRNFLWKLRNGLHFLAGRREDRLLFEYQRALAAQLHYADKPGHLAVEQFMQRYYRTVKELRLLNEILLQHFQETILARTSARTRPLNRRFRAHRGFLEVTHERVFERAPYALLELFLVLEQHKLKGVRASTIRLLRSNLHRIDQHFRQDIVARSLFLEILRLPQGLTHALRRMHAYGVLGAYIPAFGRIVGQMQHDLFHVYTVDEHTLFVVRNLRRLTVPEFQHEFPMASSLIQHVVKPERLYLAGLFHDIAKGRGGDHSELGERDAYTFCKAHDLSDYDAHFVAWLVRHHLLMSWTAQRQDLTDPEVVLQFAQKVGDQAHLDNLYLLTMADMRATSPTVWNDWKGHLLAELYAATTRVLRRGFGHPIQVADRIADLKREALALLADTGVATAAVHHHWELLDNDYFLRHDADGIAWHAERIVATPAVDLPLVAARYRPELGGTEFLVFAPDRDNLFCVTTGGIEHLNLTIVDARTHITRAGFALDTFVVLDQHGAPIRDPRAREHMQAALRAELMQPASPRASLRALLPRTLKHFPIPTRVGFSPAPGGQSTIMEVVAQDRPGLLHQVALALQHCRVRLVTAKVATYGERAEDIFFLTDQDGRPLAESAQRRCLEQEIYHRLGRAAEPAAAGVIAI